MSDLISRQAAIDLIENESRKWGDEYGVSDVLCDLSDLPSAQSERKKGKWKLNKDGNWACPFCEFDPYHDNMKGMNYCPNCGADMRGEEDGRLNQ